MKRLIALILMLLFCGVRDACAAVTEPLVYVITIKKVELSRDGGTTYVVVSSGSRSFAVRSTSAHGDILSAYVSGARIEDGEYNALRLTFSNTIGVSGRVVQNAGVDTGTTFCTGGTTGVACTPSQVNVTLTNAFVGLFGLTMPAGMTINDASSEIRFVDTSFRANVGQGLQNSYQIAFDTSQGLVIQPDNTLHPALPRLTVHT